MRNGFGRGDRSQNLPMPEGKVTMTGRAFTREQLLLTLLGVVEMVRRHKKSGVESFVGELLFESAPLWHSSCSCLHQHFCSEVYGPCL